MILFIGKFEEDLKICCARDANMENDMGSGTHSSLGGSELAELAKGRMDS